MLTWLASCVMSLSFHSLVCLQHLIQHLYLQELFENVNKAYEFLCSQANVTEGPNPQNIVLILKSQSILFSRYRDGQFSTSLLCVCWSMSMWLFVSFSYLRQVNEVNGGDNVFVRCVSVCVCSGRSWELNANSSKMVKATDFKFDTSLPRDSPDMTSKNVSKRGRGVVR